MIRRLYVENFRCLETFRLPITRQPSVLFIGKNGSGKSTLGFALELLQKIARGTNRVTELLRPRDLAPGKTTSRFEIEFDLDSNKYEYVIAFELAEDSRHLQVLEERFSYNNTPVYSRQRIAVTIDDPSGTGPITFPIDPSSVHLPLVGGGKSLAKHADTLKRWLGRMLILRPVPSLISGESETTTLEPRADMSDFAAWFSGLLAEYPSAYARIDQYLNQMMPDFKAIQNRSVGEDARSLSVLFSNASGALGVPFEDLSDGEKCFLICAVALAANDVYGPLLCFWDEPDNYLALDEVQHFIIGLRSAFRTSGQFIATSHNPEAIRSFSRENTLYLHRKSHLEPTIIYRSEDLNFSGDLVGALARGDVEPE